MKYSTIFTESHFAFFMDYTIYLDLFSFHYVYVFFILLLEFSTNIKLP